MEALRETEYLYGTLEETNEVASGGSSDPQGEDQPRVLTTAIHRAHGYARAPVRGSAAPLKVKFLKALAFQSKENQSSKLRHDRNPEMAL